MAGVESFVVCNADDVYGEVAMGMLPGQLRSTAAVNVLVGYRLQTTVATADPFDPGDLHGSF